MFALIHTLAVPFITMVLLISASGLCNTFISIKLEMEGYSPEMIGATTAALYAGIFIGSTWLDRWIAKVGLIRSFMTFALISTALVLAQTLWINAHYWLTLRFIGGICTAGIFIVLESWMLIQGPPEKRGAVLSLYLAIFYASLSAGQLLIHLCDPATLCPFYVTAALSALSIIPLCKGTNSAPKIEQPTPMNIWKLFKISPMGLTGVTVSGVMMAAIYGLLPVYAKEIGMSAPQIGNLMALLISGGLLFQWPLNKLSDRSSRKKTLIITGIFVSMISLSVASITIASLPTLFALMFLFGGFTLTIYPMSMAHASEKLENHQLVSATGGFVLTYGFGAIAGPIIAPIFMTLFGIGGLFYFLSIMGIIFIISGIKK